MESNAIINWPGITLCVSVITAACYFIRKEMLHKRAKRFDMVISKIYSAIERFINAANKVRVNINSMPLEYLKESNAKKMDEWITFSIYEMQDVASLTEMFFPSTDRECFRLIVRAALNFKSELHKAFMATQNTDKLYIYDKARTAFNKEYDSEMEKMVEMLHDRLLGEWLYDLTELRLPTKKCKRGEGKKHR